MPQPRQFSYDPACEELARHFLHPRNHHEAPALAHAIQQCVEDWLEYRSEEIRDRIRASAEDRS